MESQPTDSNSRSLSSDRPLVDPSEDRLGYAPFAKRLAESIYDLAPREGFVMALYGPWGSGKTTALGFVEHYLEEMPPADRPVLVHFNPWWFSGHEDIAREFLSEFQVTLSARKALADEVLNRLADLTRAVSESPLPHASWLKLLSSLLSKARSTNRSIPALKQEIADQLRTQKKRILVVIDDIDRLTSEETRQLFRAIKALADFPYVTYLVAFDKDVVTSALGAVQGIPGEQYLEKIVQAPFELPLPDRDALRRLLTEQLDELLADTPDQLFDRGHWANVFLEGIDYYIQTPRDINRLVNTLAVTYPAVRVEVSAVDFFAIETLRVFDSATYDLIRRNPSSFTGRADAVGSGRWTIEALRAFHDAWLEERPPEEREHLKKFLGHLFPKLNTVWGRGGYAASFDQLWQRDLRVCSPEIFPVYFRMAIPEGQISNSEIQATLAIGADEQGLTAKLLELAGEVRPDGITRIRPFLERLENYTGETISVEQAESLISVLLLIGDQLLVPGDEPKGILGFDTDLYIARVIYQLMLRLDQERRFTVFQAAIERSSSLGTLVYEVGLLERGSDRAAPSDDELLSDDQVDVLKQIALGKIREAAANGSLMANRRLMMILYRWRDWGNEDEPRQWVTAAIESDDELLAFLEKARRRIRTQGGNDPITRISFEFDVSSLEPFLDLRALVERATKLLEAPDELTEDQIEILGQLIGSVETGGDRPSDATETR